MANLPNVEIQFDNGNITKVESSDDGVFGLVASAVAVADTFALGVPYPIKGMQDVAALGILPDVNNYHLYTSLKEYYEEAGEGTKLWLFGMDKTTKVSDWFTPDVGTGKAPIEVMLDQANGEITCVFTKFAPEETYAPVITDALDADIFLAKQKAQILAENYTKLNAAPFFVLLEAYAFTGAHVDLPNVLEGDDDRGSFFIGSTEMRTGTPASLGASNHILAARLAKIPVHKNPGERKSGSLETLTAYIVDTPVELYDIEALHAKGFNTFRKHIRKSGYYISYDHLCTAPSTNDYSTITRRRVIDKAYRIAHDIASEEILADYDLTNQGTLDPYYAKALETKVESEIYTLMTARGELSIDKSNNNDKGVKASFDTTSVVANTNTLSMALYVRPKGYVEYFKILLGFQINLNN